MPRAKHAEVPEHLTLAQAHQRGSAMEAALTREMAPGGRVVTHIEPRDAPPAPAEDKPDRTETLRQTIAQVVDQAHAGNVYVNRNMVGAVVGVQPFGGEGLSGTGPKAGGPMYLLRMLSRYPADALATSLAQADAARPRNETQRQPLLPGELHQLATGDISSKRLSVG